MIRTLVFYISLALSLTISMLFALSYFILGGLGLKKLQYKHMTSVTRGWAKFMIFATGNKINVENIDLVPEGPVLFVANHQSYYDIPVFMAEVPYPAPFIAKVELEKIPMLSFWMKKMGCLFMDRSNMRQSLKIILEGIEKLKDGTSMVIFPEGTRSKGGEIGDFKPGSLKLAVKAGVPIVPVTLVNTYKVYEEENRIKTANVSMIYHEPIDTASLTREEINNLHKTVREIIKSKMER